MMRTVRAPSAEVNRSDWGDARVRYARMFDRFDVGTL